MKACASGGCRKRQVCARPCVVPSHLQPVLTVTAAHASDYADPNCKSRRQSTGRVRRLFDRLESLSPLWVHDKLFRAIFVNIPEVLVLSLPFTVHSICPPVLEVASFVHGCGN